MTLVDLPWCRAGPSTLNRRFHGCVLILVALGFRVVCTSRQHLEGVGICYDARFPELALAMRAQGAKAGGKRFQAYHPSSLSWLSVIHIVIYVHMY